jgi:hypothetical protein
VAHAEQAEIDQMARALVGRYGAEAEVVAAGQADTMLDAGDIQAFGTWKAVMAAIRRLQAAKTG